MKEKIWRYCEEGKEERYTLKHWKNISVKSLDCKNRKSRERISLIG